MKKYPFSKKAIQAMLAAAIAISPVATSGVLSPVQVEAASTVEADVRALAEKFIIFYPASGGISTSAAISYSDIESTVGKDLSDTEKTALVRLFNNTAKLIFSNYSNASSLQAAINKFRTDNASDFNTLFDSDSEIVVEELISFVSDLEGELEDEIKREVLRVFMGDTPSSYSTIVNNAVSNTFENSGTTYTNLNGKLTDIGLSVEKLFSLQEKLNNTKFDSDKSKRAKMLQSALSAKGASITNSGNDYSLTVSLGGSSVSVGENLTWSSSNSNIATFNGNTLVPVATGNVVVSAKMGDIVLATKNVSVTVPGGGTGGSGGSGGTGGSGGNTDDGTNNPGTPSEETSQKPVDLPDNSTEKVTDNGTVTTKVPAEKVQAIVDLITKEKSIIPVGLEKPAEGEKVRAEVPATLFSEAAQKNAQAVVNVQTEEASYKLPVSEVNVASLAQSLGVAASDVQIRISVNVVNVEDVQDTITQNGLTTVSQVIEFTVEAVAGDKSESISRFSTYVQREIVGEKEFNARQSAVVVLGEDGTIRSIPALFDGKKVTAFGLTNSKYVVVENDKTFPDVDNNKNWAEEYIETLASKYIIKGKDNGNYAPNEQMNRAQFTVLLVRALGLPTEEYDNRFPDVKGDEWFNANGELMAAVKYGIIKGRDNGNFDPNAKITRSQAAVMIGRAMKLDFLNYDESKLDDNKKVTDFKDASTIGAWAKEDIEAVYQAGIMTGKDDNSFDPNGNTKRDQMAKILGEFLISANLMNDTINE